MESVIHVAEPVEGLNVRLYYVETWDMNREEFTPQEGVPKGPYTHFGLREAVRALREIGYTVWNDPSVYISSEDTDADGGTRVSK